MREMSYIFSIERNKQVNLYILKLVFYLLNEIQYNPVLKIGLYLIFDVSFFERPHFPKK